MVKSYLPRYQEFYTLAIELQDPAKPYKVEAKWSVGAWFDKEGRFDEQGFKTEVKKLINSFEKQKFD